MHERVNETQLWMLQIGGRKRLEFTTTNNMFFLTLSHTKNERGEEGSERTQALKGSLHRVYVSHFTSYHTLQYTSLYALMMLCHQSACRHNNRITPVGAYG